MQSVEPDMKENELGDKLADMTSGENSDLGKLVSVGDTQAALRLAGAVNSCLMRRAQNLHLMILRILVQGKRKEKRCEQQSLKRQHHFR